MAASEYQKRQDGDNTVFEVTPATAPPNTVAGCMAIMWCLVFGGIAFGTGSVVMGVIVVIIALLLYRWGSKDKRPKAQQVKSVFRVSSTSIETNGLTFKKDDIHRLIIKNAISGNLMDPALVLASGSKGLAVGRQYGIQLATVANSLELETGGKSYLLAGGMNETTAYGLMTDVGKIIGL